MKITQFIHLYPPAIYGGGEFLFFQYAKELAKRGHEVNVITQMLHNTKRFEVLEGVKIHRIGRPLRYEGHLNMNVFSNISFILKSIREGLRIARGSDIIHSNAYAPAISGHIVSRLLKIPHVISLFDVYSKGSFWKKWSKQAGVSRSINIAGPIMERLLLKLKPELIHTISEASKKDLLKAGVRAPIKIVPCCIDTRNFKPGRAKPKNQFCYVGRHVFYKNVDTVIRAMPLILGKNPDTKFIIIGDGPMKKPWQELARKLGVIDSVIFTGRVSNEVKIKIMRESKFLVLPSTIEGFGIVLLEAWALNRPTIVSNVPPLNSLVDKNKGLLVRPHSPKDWAHAIIKMLGKQQTDLRKFAKEYDVKKVVPLFEKMLNSALAHTS